MSDRRTAIVTGAGTGIGRSVALALLREGYTVVLAGRRRQMLEETARQAPPESHAIVAPADVADPSSVASLFRMTRDTLGRLDLLFNNAGLASLSASIEDVTLEQWKTVVDVNLTGAFLCTQEAFRLMKTQKPIGGRIINNGSISAHVPRPNSAPYTATKHAITGLTKSTSLDGRKYDIACGQIDMGSAATPLTEGMKAGSLQAHGTRIVEPTIDPEHVARAVAYMAGLPLDVNVLTVMATKMPCIGRG